MEDIEGDSGVIAELQSTVDNKKSNRVDLRMFVQ
jgi:hypothetical protein